MAIALVQSKTGTTSPISPTSAFTAGNLLVLWVGYNANEAGQPTVSDGSNTWHPIRTPSGNSTLGESCQMFYAWNCNGGTPSIAISGTTSGVYQFDVAEFSGVQNTSDPLDTSNSQNATTGDANNSSPVTTTVANDLLTTVFDWGTVGGTFSGIWAVSPFDDTTGAWGLATSAGSYSMNLSAGTNTAWTSAVAAFKPASAAAPIYMLVHP